MNYKDTLNLPITTFPMKADLPVLEPSILKQWEASSLYDRLREVRADRQVWILHDGPPYANGHIHIGHALNKILKDFVVKSKSMFGYNATYVPGWDCHGLPIEHQVDKNLGSKKTEVSLVEKRQLCREYAARFVDIQRAEFRRLGVLGNWSVPYLTMDYMYEATIVRELGRLFGTGAAYKGKKPVHGPGRGRGRVCRSYIAVHLRQVSAYPGCCGAVADAPGKTGVCRDLDDDTMDAAGESGDCRTSGRIVRDRRIGR
jgi:isoleucyl-tRNA synthetase